MRMKVIHGQDEAQEAYHPPRFVNHPFGVDGLLATGRIGVAAILAV
jgi:hypothetical protein